MMLKGNSGFSLVEMMISLLVAALISLAAVTVFAKQSVVFTTQARRGQSGMSGLTAFNTLSRMLRQAESSSITITSSTGTVTVDFSLPDGVPIWPNTTAPYTNRFVRLSWSDSGGSANQVLVASAADSASLANATPTSLIGFGSSNNVRITALGVSTVASGIYRLSLSVASGFGSGGSDGETVFEGDIAPRN